MFWESYQNTSLIKNQAWYKQYKTFFIVFNYKHLTRKRLLHSPILSKYKNKPNISINFINWNILNKLNLNKCIYMVCNASHQTSQQSSITDRVPPIGAIPDATQTWPRQPMTHLRQGLTQRSAQTSGMSRVMPWITWHQPSLISYANTPTRGKKTNNQSNAVVSPDDPDAIMRNNNWLFAFTTSS